MPRHDSWLQAATVPRRYHQTPRGRGCELSPSVTVSAAETTVYQHCLCGWLHVATFGTLPTIKRRLRAIRELQLGERQVRKRHAIPGSGERCGAPTVTQRPSYDGLSIYRSCPVCNWSERYDLQRPPPGLPGFDPPRVRWPERPQAGARPAAAFEWDTCRCHRCRKDVP